MNTIKRLIFAALFALSAFPAFAQAPPPVPALPDTERRTSYSISGTTCACAVNFALYGDSTDYGDWLEVFLNGVLQSSTTYTITSPTGPLATIPRPITDAVLTFNASTTGTVQIVGARRPRRTSQFSENRGVAARDLNQVITDIVAMLREDWDKINDVTGRAVLAAPGETLALLPAKATRANTGACFDSNGNLTNCVSIPASTFIGGNGITLSGVNPTTITNNISAGTGISITGTSPSPLLITASLPVGTIGVSSCGAIGNLLFNNTSNVLGCSPLTAGTGITLSGTANLTVAVTSKALHDSTPSNPAATTGAMLGMGAGTGACTITPTVTGNIRVTFDGIFLNNTANTTAQALGKFGTGTAPANGNAQTGTTFGTQKIAFISNNGAQYPFSISAIITGLTLSTAVWFDIYLVAGTGGTASVTNPHCSIDEI